MLSYLPVVIWLIPWYFFFRIASRKPSLQQFAPRTGRPLTVIIPARNEAGVIENCVRSILRSSYTPLEVLVVDDRSTDRTAEIVARIAAEDPRLRLVRGEPLPEGWYGKPWACVQGYRAATGELLCFTDADTTHAPDLLPLSAGAAEALEAALFTVLPSQTVLTWSERLILPQFFYLLMAKYNPAAINRATHVRDMIANGQFIFISREWYERVGTHEKVKHEVAEDLAIGQEVFARGGRVRAVYALEQMATRMYTDWAHLREGFSKNLFLGS
ncbi:MAG: glycosyltransferase, partial [Gemmatimonadetes bacterium]|nr:glycosyltransferase [Gemmatimonadota bacterium]